MKLEKNGVIWETNDATQIDAFRASGYVEVGVEKSAPITTTIAETTEDNKVEVAVKKSGRPKKL